MLALPLGRAAARARAVVPEGHGLRRRAAGRRDRQLEGKWPDKVLRMQENWIGRSEGARIKFPLGDAARRRAIEVFTTRPDTLYGVTFMSIAAEHPLVERRRRPRRRRSPPRSRKEDKIKRSAEDYDKRGVDTGLRVQASDHRRRDPDLRRQLRAHGLRHRRGHGGAGARSARLRVRDEVRAAQASRDPARRRGARCRDDEGGLHRHAASWSTRASSTGSTTRAAKAKITEKAGEATVSYRLRDWLLSRQRYWGAPDPDGQVRDARLPAGARERAAGAAARRRDAGRGRPLAAGDASDVDADDVPDVRRPGAGARPTRWTASWSRRGTSCATARRTPPTGSIRRRGRLLDARRPVHRRRRARDQAPHLRPLLHQDAARLGLDQRRASTSRSRGF